MESLVEAKRVNFSFDLFSFFSLFSKEKNLPLQLQSLCVRTPRAPRRKSILFCPLFSLVDYALISRNKWHPGIGGNPNTQWRKGRQQQKLVSSRGNEGDDEDEEIEYRIDASETTSSLFQLGGKETQWTESETDSSVAYMFVSRSDRTRTHHAIHEYYQTTVSRLEMFSLERNPTSSLKGRRRRSGRQVLKLFHCIL